jgi:hypothetical protein
MLRPEQYGELRVLDLVCKLSRASPHNVTNMLNAIRAVADHFEDSVPDVLDMLLYEGPPSPANVAACAQASADIVSDQGFSLPPARPRPPQRIARRAARN